jgi:hypothetical protein
MAHRIACTAIDKRIMLGRVNKAGNSFIGEPQDVTSDVLKAVIEKCGVGNSMPVTIDGKPKYKISIEEIST